jgi:hypothetical protein
VKVKTNYGVTTAVSLKKVVDDEKRLTKREQFTSTPVMNDLKNVRGKK